MSDDNRMSRIHDSISEEARRIGSVIEFPQWDETSTVMDRSAMAIYLGSTQAKSDPDCQEKVRKALALGLPIFPVIEASNSHTEQVPSELEYVKALTWSCSDTVPTQVISSVLEVLGINEKERRLFISYRQLDAKTVATDLFHALIEKRFQVFLDRFQTTFVENIQDRIDEALEDMAFVLLLYSPDMPNSPWVDWEITRALKSQLPILVVRWTTATEEVPKVRDGNLPTIMFDPDIDYVGDAIRCDKLQEILDAVERLHSDGLRRRRRESMTAARLLAEATGWVVTEEPRWKLVLTQHHGGQLPVLLGITPRLARTEDLYELACWRPHLEGAEVTWRRALMQASTELPHLRSELLRWVIASRDLKIIPGPTRLGCVL